MITADIVKYYVALLIMQYVGKPKAESTIALLCGSLIADQIYTQTRDAFDIETATGKQLEMIGNYVKAYRNVLGLPQNRSYFSLPFYTDADTFSGFSFYGDEPVNDMINYRDAQSTIYYLTDDELRNLITLKIAQNSSNHSLESIDIIMDAVFGTDCVMVDNGNMTMAYLFYEGMVGNLANIAQFVGALPRPAGVYLQVLRVENIDQIFAFASYGETDLTGIFVGFGLYSSPQNGSIARYV